MLAPVLKHVPKSTCGRFALAVPLLWVAFSVGFFLRSVEPAVPSLFATSNSTPARHEAFVFIMTSGVSHLRGLLALNAALVDVNTTRPRIALCTPDVPPEVRDILELAGIGVVELPPSPQAAGYTPVEARWASLLSKLEVWRLEGFDRIVFLDCDLTLHDNIDFLFDVENEDDVVGMQDNWGCAELPSKLCSGVVSLKPDPFAYDTMLMMAEHATWTNGDQEILEAYLRDVVGRPAITLPESYAGFVWRCQCLGHISVNYDASTVPIVHFTGSRIDYEQIARYGPRARWGGDAPCVEVHYERWLETYKMAADHLQREMDRTNASDDLRDFAKKNVLV
eukprot:m51a1_g613 putative galactinol synthase (337) ;mRNA; f:93986-95241